jgi:uncharacterized protein (TIGR03437 family)
VVGDFNEDGKPELAIANWGKLADDTDPGGVLVFLGQGNGSFQSPASYSAGINPDFITAADVNGDRAADLLVATRAPNFVYRVAVLLGSGNGSFGPATQFATDYGPAWIAVTDLNGDGKPDLAIAHCSGSTDATMMFGNGAGTFQPDIHLLAAVSPAALLVTDLNGDGRPDLIVDVGAFPSSAVAVLLNISLNNLNGASFLAGPLAPDSFSSAFGNGLPTLTQSGTLPYSTNLGGTTVTLNDSAGVQQPTLLSYVSPTQVNYIVPHATALGQATLTIAVGGVAASSAVVTIAAIDPGLFLFSGTNLAAANVLRVRADGSQTVEDVYAVDAHGALVAAPIDVSPANGQVYLILYATGLRGHSEAANSVTVTAGGTNLPLYYAGAEPQFPGLDQINVLQPPSLAGKGDVAIQVTVDGEAANAGHVTIQ